MGIDDSFEGNGTHGRRDSFEGNGTHGGRDSFELYVKNPAK